MKSTRGARTDNEFSVSRQFPRKMAVVLMFGIGLVTTLQAGDLPFWSRGFSFHPTSGYTLENRFSLRGITQTRLHLTGECAYYQLENQIPRIISIGGTKTADGRFWPDVTSQVKNERTGKWKTIAKPIRSGFRATITIKPGEFNPDLLVALDVFFPQIGQYRVGRLLLKTGDAAEFVLKDLLPPEEERKAKLRPRKQKRFEFTEPSGSSGTSERPIDQNESLRLTRKDVRAYSQRAQRGDADAAMKLWQHYDFAEKNYVEGAHWKSRYEALKQEANRNR